MRIISGEARGRNLFAPSGNRTRPTSDKLRGALFNILSSRVCDAEVLDLFGGTGALALEALSRGAARAVIVDKDRVAVELIYRNARNVLGEAFESRVRILQSDYRSALKALGDMGDRQFDLVFLDPPYRMTEAYADAISRLDQGGMLCTDPLVVCERAREFVWEPPVGFMIFDSRDYSDTSLDFLRRRNVCASSEDAVEDAVR